MWHIRAAAIILLLGAVGLACVPAQATHDDEAGALDGPKYSPYDEDPIWANRDTMLFISGRPCAGEPKGVAVFAVGVDGADLRRVSPRGYYCMRASCRSPLAIVWSFDIAANITHTCLLDLQSGKLTQLVLRFDAASLLFGASDDELLCEAYGRTGGTSLRGVRVDGTGHVRAQWPLLASDRHATHPSISPDGKRLAYVQQAETGRCQIMVCPLLGTSVGAATSVRSVEEGSVSYYWLADSQRILHYTHAGQWITNVDTGTTQDYGVYLKEQGKLPPTVVGHVTSLTPNPFDTNRMACRVSHQKGPGLIGVYIAVMDFDGGNFRQLTFETPEAGIPYAYDKQFDVPVDSGLK